MQRQLRTYIVPFVIILTVLLLTRFPLADCIDCEGPHPWGRNDASYLLRSNIFLAWLFGTSFLFGLFRVRGGWVAPPLIALGDCLTQHIGGVPWWSLLGNEGPFILAIDSFVGLTGLALGGCASFLVKKAQARHRIV